MVKSRVMGFVAIENEYDCLDSCPPTNPVQLYSTCYIHFPIYITLMLTAFTTCIIVTIIMILACRVKDLRNRQRFEAELLNRLKEKAVRIGVFTLNYSNIILNYVKSVLS